VAENDKIFPRDHGRRLAELLPRGEFALPDSRTFIPDEQPQLLADAIEDFLSR
jgi:pimeloyl-ACP methyl ester carboxylesterase